MRVVGKQNDLSLIGDLIKHGKPRAGALIIEMDKEIVKDHRKCPLPINDMFKRGEPQLQVQLIPSTSTETRHAHPTAIGRSGEEHRDALRRRIGIDSCIFARRQGREMLLCSSE